MTLRVNKSIVSGSFKGRSGNISVSGSVKGSYDMKTGAIQAGLSGTWKIVKDCKGKDCSGSIQGSISGRQEGTGFSGTGRGKGMKQNIFGSWSVSGGRLVMPK